MTTPSTTLTNSANKIMLVRVFGVFVSLVAALPGAAGIDARGGEAPQSPNPAGRVQPNQNPDHADVRVLHVQGNVYMLAGASGNITLQAGDDGVLLVDTSLEALSDKVVAAIRSLSDKPIRYIINTHAHPDHVGGNAPIAKAGATIAGGNMGVGANTGASILSHENVLNRMTAPTGRQAPTPAAAWPTDTYFTKKKELFFNGEAIEIIHQPAAHTDGDSLVFFRRSDVLSSGDLFGTITYPVIDLERGGNIQGIVDALNTMLDITIPKDKQEGGTYVIPGHGRLCDEADVLEYRDMVTIIRDRIQDLVKKGMTLEQVKAARPTLDYDGRYGARTGSWTTDMFVEAAYRTISAAKSKSQ
jgi:cyclase